MGWFKRKLVLALLGVVVTMLQNTLGLTPDQADNIVKLLMTWIGVEGTVDAVGALKRSGMVK